MFLHIHLTVTKRAEVPVIVREWSLGIPPNSLDGLDELQKNLAFKAYASVQLLAFEQGSRS